MKTVYDPETDTLTVQLRSVPVAESHEDRPGIIFDYDAAGNLIAIEILDASQRVDEVGTMHFQALASAA